MKMISMLVFVCAAVGMSVIATGVGAKWERLDAVEMSARMVGDPIEEKQKCCDRGTYTACMTILDQKCLPSINCHENEKIKSTCSDARCRKDERKAAVCSTPSSEFTLKASICKLTGKSEDCPRTDRLLRCRHEKEEGNITFTKGCNNLVSLCEGQELTSRNCQ